MPIIINGNPARGRSHRIVVSLCDFSGNWARPFAEDLGYTVAHFDLKHGDDVLDFGRTIGAIAEDPEADRYTKRTGIWGNVTRPCENPREPVMFEKRRADGRVVRGSWMWANLGGKSERTKELRSMTPRGFARAFAASNR